MKDYRAIEIKINTMIERLKRIADSQTDSYHTSLENQAKVIDNAHKDIEFFSNLK